MTLRCHAAVAMLLAMALGGQAHAAPPDPELLLALRGLMAREERITSVSGYLAQHQMRSPDNVARERAQLLAGAPSTPGTKTVLAPVAEDGFWATAFAADAGRCRFETLVFQPGMDDWGASISLLPWVAGTAARTVVTEDGTVRTDYSSTRLTARIVAQETWPSVVERHAVSRALMLAAAGFSRWSRGLAWRMTLAGQKVTQVPEAYTTTSADDRAAFRELKPLPVTTVEGQACSGYEALLVDKAGEPSRTRVWYSEKLGYAVVRYEDERPVAAKPGLRRVERRLARDWIQAGEGLWLPTFTTISTCELDVGGQRSNLVTLLSRFRELSCAKREDDTFKAHLPLGTYVQDTVGHGPYVVGEVLDSDAIKLVAADREQWAGNLDWLLGKVAVQP